MRLIAVLLMTAALAACSKKEAAPLVPPPIAPLAVKAKTAAPSAPSASASAASAASAIHGAAAIPTPAAAPAASAKPAPAQPVPAQPVLSTLGYGTVRFGMKLQEVEALVGDKPVPLGESDPACSSVRFAALPGVRFMVEQGVVTRADAGPAVANALGIAVGDTLAQVKAKFPAVALTPHKYLPGGHYLTFDSADKHTAVIMEEDGKKITKIRSGLQPAVAYVEVCL